MNYFLFYLIHFAVLAFLGGVLINGWYLVTRGQWKREIDGTRTKDGAIFKGWWFYWYKEKRTPHRKYYDDESLYKLINLISGNAAFRGKVMLTTQPIPAEYAIRPKHGSAHARPVDVLGDLLLGVDRVQLEEYTGAKFQVINDSLGNPLMHGAYVVGSFYQEETAYVYPDWLRTVLAGCITCFASVYGSIVFWTAINLFGRDWISNTTEYPEPALFFTWIAYMLSLAYVNTYLWKRNNK